MQKKLSQRKIAEVLNISQTTVSLVLSGKGATIPEDTQRRILDLVQRPVDIPFPQVKTRQICYLTDLKGSRNFFNDNSMIEGIQHAVSEMKYNLTFSSYKEYSFFEHTLPRVDGCIIREQIPESEIMKIARHKPCVLLNNNGIKNTKLSSVLPDNEAGVIEAFQHLYESGHRDIGFFGRKPDGGIHPQHLLRYKAFMDISSKMGCHPEKFLYTYELEKAQGNLDSLGAIMTGYLKYLAEAPERPTAIIFAASVHAMKFAILCERFGIKIPDDISIIGFDDFRACSLLDPPLSTINQPFNLMGKEAVYLLKKHMDNAETAVKEIVLMPSLNITGSIGGIKFLEKEAI